MLPHSHCNCSSSSRHQAEKKLLAIVNRTTVLTRSSATAEIVRVGGHGAVQGHSR